MFSFEKQFNFSLFVLKVNDISPDKQTVANKLIKSQDFGYFAEKTEFKKLLEHLKYKAHHCY